MRDTIEQVLAAEDEASRLVEAARAEGEALLADYRRRARELEASGERERRRASAELLAAAAEAARVEREARLRQASVELEAVLHVDEATVREAVEAVVRCVRGQGRP